MKFIAIVIFTMLAQSAIAQWRPQFEDHLKMLQSRQSSEMGYEIYNIAMTWAAAGHIHQANELLTQSWKTGIADPESFHHTDDGLRILWALSGQVPDTLPFGLRAVNEIVQDNWDDKFNTAQWAAEFTKQLAGKSWQDLNGVHLYATAVLLCYDKNDPHHRSPDDQRREALQAFVRLMQTDSLAGYQFFHAGTCAALDATSLGDTAQAARFIRNWGRGYLQWPENYMLESLMKDTATARLLLSGLLQPIWGLDATECNRELTEIKRVLAARQKKGPTLVYGNLTLRQLLQKLSEAAIKDSSVLDPAVFKSRWLGHPPASEAAIAAAEKQLGVKLPEEYKSFLRVTNGLYSAGSTSPSFLPVEKIGLLKDKDPDLVSIWGDNSPSDDAEEAAGLKRSILVAGEQEEQQFLLVPPGGKNQQWQFWFFANWIPGVEKQISLRFWLEHELLLLQRH